MKYIKSLPILFLSCSLVGTAQAATLFSNAVDTNFLTVGNWDNRVPDGTNGAGRITGDAQLSADHNAGSSNIIVGFGSDGNLTIDADVTLRTTGKVDVGRIGTDSATGSLTLNGTLETGNLNVLDGTLTVANSVDLQGTTTIYSGGTLAAGGNTIDMVANSGAQLYFKAGSTVTGSPTVLQLRNNTTLGFEIDGSGNHAVIAGNSMQVRLGSFPDLVVDFLVAPTIGDTFDFLTGVEKFTDFNGVAASGFTFEDVTVNGLGAGQNYNLIYDQTVTDAGYLRLQVIPEPSSTALLGLGGLALILRRRK